MNSLLLACLVGGGVTLVIGLAAHVALWPWRTQLAGPPAYTVGSICVVIGVAVGSWIVGDWSLLALYLACLLPFGFAIHCAWWIRARLTDRDVAERTIAAARKAMQWEE